MFFILRDTFFFLASCPELLNLSLSLSLFIYAQIFQKKTPTPKYIALWCTFIKKSLLSVFFFVSHFFLYKENSACYLRWSEIFTQKIRKYYDAEGCKNITKMKHKTNSIIINGNK